MIEIETTDTPSITIDDKAPKTWLTITTEGKLIVGPDLSEDEATQRVAKMLCDAYAGHVVAELTRLRKEVAELREVYEAARGLTYGTDWNQGTQAKNHGYRDRLIASVAAIAEARRLAALTNGETDE